jgi:hypothetical protein
MMMLLLRSRRRSRRPASAGLRSVEAILPGIIGGLALVVLAAAIVVLSLEAPRSSIASRLYSAVDLFTGAYIPLAGQDDKPTPAMAWVGLSALSVTFTAALTALLSLTTRAREWLRARRAGQDLVVIGSGEPAAQILRSHPRKSTRGLLLVTGSRQGPAALAARGHAATAVMDLHTFAEDAAADLRARGGTLAVATDDDALNIAIAEALTRQEVTDGKKVMAIVRHPALAEELRPPVISGGLRMPYGISCPAENIAEQVCHHLDQALTRDPALKAAGQGTVIVDGDDEELSAVVETWVRRFTWSRSFLRDGARERVPLLRMTEQGEGDAPGPVFRIFVGADPAETAARTLKGVRLGDAERSRLVAVTSARLIPTAQAGRVVVVDELSAAWDQRLVFDDIAEQWGRVYHSVYCVLFDSFTDWSEVHTGREGQSSIAAGQHMLRLLDRHGYHLVKVEDRPTAPAFTADELTSMAAAEHEEWRLKRKYRDEHGRKISVAGPNSPYRLPWEELPEHARRNNETLVDCTVPALAALFGYEVRRKPATSVG